MEPKVLACLLRPDKVSVGGKRGQGFSQQTGQTGVGVREGETSVPLRKRGQGMEPGSSHSRPAFPAGTIAE